MQVDSHSIKQVFDAEKQDLAIFDKKAMIFNEIFYKNMKAELIVNRFLIRTFNHKRCWTI